MLAATFDEDVGDTFGEHGIGGLVLIEVDARGVCGRDELDPTLRTGRASTGEGGRPGTRLWSGER